MREKWARRIVLLTAVIVLLLAFVFAQIQNPAESFITKDINQQPSYKKAQIDGHELKRIEAGRQLYLQQRCALCHSIAGQGNPRNSLDGIGIKHSATELRDFIIGADTLQGVLPDNILKIKQQYRRLPANQLDDLVIYMQSLGT